LVIKKEDKILLHIHLLDNITQPQESNYRRFLHLEGILNGYNIPSIAVHIRQFTDDKESVIERIVNLMIR
jgi:hypothetical protein